MSSVMWVAVAAGLYVAVLLGKFATDEIKARNKPKTGFDNYAPGYERIMAELESMTVSQAQRRAAQLLDKSRFLITTPPDASAPGPSFDKLTRDQRELLGRYGSISIASEDGGRISAADASPFGKTPEFIRLGSGDMGSDILVRPGRDEVLEYDDGTEDLATKSIWHFIIYWHMEAELTAACDETAT